MEEKGTAVSMNRKKTLASPTRPDAETLRYFTIETANRTLPLVRRIVADIVREYQAMDMLRLDLITRGGSRSAELPEARRRELEASIERVNRYLGELSDLGVQFKDWKLGLVDFPALREGRPVCLCWKQDEDRISHWHESSEGFAGRKPLETTAE